MAIKVIKHGETKFKLVCPVCGCEFEYEYEDLVECYIPGFKQIKCPDCGEWLTHRNAEPVKSLEKDITWKFPKYGEPIPCSDKEARDKMFYVDYPNPNVKWTSNLPDWPDCETCPNKPDPTKTIVGDTPCTWCRKNQPYCFTSNKSTNSVTYTVNPESYKDTITTFSNSLNNNSYSDIKTAYTTNIKTEK